MRIFLLVGLLLFWAPSSGFADDSQPSQGGLSPEENLHGYSDFESLPIIPQDSSPDSHLHQPFPDTSYSTDEAPKGLFLNITMAKGFEEDMEFRRNNVYYPVDPTEVFTTDALAVFLVFRVFKHYAPYQIIGRLYAEDIKEIEDPEWFDEDGVYLATEDESGYLKFFPPPTGWQSGKYRVEVYLGYEVSSVNRMGTMRFSMNDPVSKNDN